MMPLAWNPVVVAEAASRGLCFPSDLERVADRIGQPLMTYSTADWGLDQLRLSVRLAEQALANAEDALFRPVPQAFNAEIFNRVRRQAVQQAAEQAQRAREELAARLDAMAAAAIQARMQEAPMLVAAE